MVYQQMNKEIVVHIHNGILLSHKRNKYESFELMLMNLDEPVIQSEVSKKNLYRILMHIYGI